MITVQWDIPFLLSTSQGQLAFNELVSSSTREIGYYMLDPQACKSGVGLRVTRTNISQAGGEIIHRKFETGAVMVLTIELWERIGEEGMPACGGVLREMVDHLSLHLNAMINDEGRIQWTPPVRSGDAALVDRMLSPVRVLGPSGDGGESFVTAESEKPTETPLVTVTFAMLSPFPYARDAPEVDTVITGTTTVTNGGNAEDYPIFEIDGPTDAFTITNLSSLDEQGNPRQIVYLGDALPGGIAIAAGHFAEIDCFRNTIYLDGNMNNLKPGIDVLNSDFFALVPGDNDIEIVGASGLMKWQNAYR